MNLFSVKRIAQYAWIMMATLLVLLLPKTLLALELDIAAEVISVTAPGSAERHKIFLSRLKKISNSLSRDEYQMIQGVRRGQTFKALDDAGLDEVIDSVRRGTATGFEPLFECEGRGCGSSVEWANAVFNEPKLYGPESTQFYWVGKASQAETYWLIYGSKRSNKPVHFRIESIVSVAPGLKSRLITAFTESRYLRLAWTEVVANETLLAETLGSWCAQYESGQSSGDGPQQVAVAVSDGRAGMAPSEAIEHTSRLASALLTRLSTDSLKGCQFSAFGLGGLTPIEGLPSERLDLILLP